MKAWAPITVAPAPTSLGYRFAKRALDVVVAAVGLAIFLPLIGVLVLLTRLDSPGPAIFRQTRVGYGGRLFTFYKFRTMYVDAKERFPDLYDYEYTDEEWRELFYKLPDDPRLTPFGRRLRKTTLDELPNLFNVLLGQMSLVGPRPELPEYARYYTPEQMVNFSVPPGATGLAQTSGRALLSVQERIEADVEYVRRRSFWFDLVLLARTVKMVILRIGAF
jgi:lipopolysaccharide/colanic/teichoic acid biosynthesis glycosyltransferase